MDSLDEEDKEKGNKSFVMHVAQKASHRTGVLENSN